MRKAGSVSHGRGGRPLCHCGGGLRATTAGEHRIGEATLSARVHQGWRSGIAQELARLGLRRVALDARTVARRVSPKYHNVYMEPGSCDIYKKTGQFPAGTIFFKQLQRVLKLEHFPDESCTEPSGRGYFPGEPNGADVTVKDTKRYAETGGWGYYNFNHHEPKAPTAKLRPQSECAFCHIASAKKDEVWTPFYRELDN